MTRSERVFCSASINAVQPPTGAKKSGRGTKELKPEAHPLSTFTAPTEMLCAA